ncbi:MAG TPA: DUF488 domain-containing protein [Anaerolineaceae bacterium]|nr:DUF488 domain-containing protein [Anaerolineaceae bacterium]
MLLTTLGYEGLNIDQFFNILYLYGVEVLVDIREKPISRKPGFSKKSLITTANNFQIDYINIPELGSPMEVRHDFHEDCDWEKFTFRYQAYLSSKDREIDSLTKIVAEKVCCLLCFEADYKHCHRLFVTEKICKSLGDKLRVIHLDKSAITPLALQLPLADISTRL